MMILFFALMLMLLTAISAGLLQIRAQQPAYQPVRVQTKRVSRD